MAAHITEGYPYKLSDKEIQRDIDGFVEEIIRLRANAKTINQFAPLIQLGQAELQNRKSKRTNLYTFFISLSSLIIALSALFASYQSTQSSSRWEKSQIQLLTELKLALSNVGASSHKNVIKVPVSNANRLKSKTLQQKN